MSLYFILENQLFYIQFLSFEKKKELNNLKDLFCIEIIF